MSRYALPLSGYDNASVWGYDDLDSTYYAHLWRNASDSRNDPDLWLTWLTEQMPIGSAARLATMIAARAGVSVADVMRAMAATKTAPEASDLAELARALSASATN